MWRREGQVGGDPEVKGEGAGVKLHLINKETNSHIHQNESSPTPGEEPQNDENQ